MMEKNIFNTCIIPEEEQLQKIVKTYSINQLYWLHGLVSGLIADKQSVSEVMSIPTPKTGVMVSDSHDSVKILFATQSGNSRKIASQLEAMALERDIKIEVIDMTDFNPNKLRKEKYVIIICSTQGEGDPPLTGEDFYSFIHGTRINSLANLHYAVLALGDKSYLNFCKVGRDIDKRLFELGAKPIIPLGECDVDYRKVSDYWIANLTDQLAQVYAPETASVKIQAVNINERPTGKIEVFTRTKPGMLKVMETINLNGRGSGKTTTHIEVADETGQLTYRPGDSLGIYFQNSSVLVEEILTKLRIPGAEIIQTDPGIEITILEYLKDFAEITQLTRDVLEKYHSLKPNKRLQEIINDNKNLSEYLYGRDFLDLIAEFPVSLTASALAGIVGKMQPRLYSIASSPYYIEGEAHLTVAALTYLFNNRKKYGACSTYATGNLGIGRSVKAFVSENENFRLPDSAADIIMIGPGTGVAPFRAFIQEREIMGATGKNWLFFGNQHFTIDFLYQTEWQAWKKKKMINRIDLAFSRDQAEKKYVQHLMSEESRELYRWINNGAHIYICGNKNRMAKDVNQTLLNILVKEGNMNDEMAGDYLKNLKKQRRYHEDVY